MKNWKNNNLLRENHRRRLREETERVTYDNNVKKRGPYKYEVCVRPYDVMPDEDIPVKHICYAKNDIQALKLAVIGYPDAWDLDDWTDKDIKSELEELGLSGVSKSDLVDELDGMIDSGSNLIFYIKNLTTGRYIYKSDYINVNDQEE